MSNQDEIIKEIAKKIKQGKENSKEKIISKYQFYFETALYKGVFCDNPEDNLFYGSLDAYNSLDGFDTTYSIESRDIDSFRESGWPGFKKIMLNCKRGGKTVLRFFVVVFKDGMIMKVGQWPSLADIQFAEINEKYSNYLSKEDLKNYKKAIGIYSHGAGAGSFVYLRRIFENLIFQTYEKHKDVLENKENNFRLNRMEDKIEILKNYLPSQLLEMKSIYGILSKGVHELSEEECLDYFSSIKLSIELILDQKIEQHLKEQRDGIVKKKLQEINKKIKSNEKK